jgi:hypothetical protein
MPDHRQVLVSCASCIGFHLVQAHIKGILRPTVSGPACLGVRHPSGTHTKFLISLDNCGGEGWSHHHHHNRRRRHHHLLALFWLLSLFMCLLMLNFNQTSDCGVNTITQINTIWMELTHYLQYALLYNSSLTNMWLCGNLGASPPPHERALVVLSRSPVCPPHTRARFWDISIVVTEWDRLGIPAVTDSGGGLAKARYPEGQHSSSWGRVPLAWIFLKSWSASIL